jgi:hypothetical protein
MSIKKAYLEIIELLEANKSKKVSSLMPEILALCESKTVQKTFKLNEANEVTHIFCYYHKVWEALEETAFGSKKHSTTGFNTMCKKGANQWSKQQRDAKKAKDELLNNIATGVVSTDDMTEMLANIEVTRTTIVDTSNELYTTKVKTAQVEYTPDF